MIYQIILPLGIPSKKNSKRIFTNRATGKPFITSSSAYHTWQKRTKPLMMRPLMSPFTSCVVTIEVNDCSKRKYDLSNKAESILDCLVDAHVLADDNRFVVRELRLIGISDKAKEQGYLITIEGGTE